MHALPSLFRAALLLSAATFTARPADIVSFNLFTGTRNLMYPADASGAPGVRTTNWMSVTSSTLSWPAGSVYNSVGTFLPTLTMDLTAGGNFSDRAVGTTNESKMFNCVIDKFEGTPGSVVVAGIPYAKYNVYFYFLPDNGSGAGNTRGGYFTLTNSADPAFVARRYLKNQDASFTQLNRPTDTGTGYIKSTTDFIPPSGGFTNIQGGNYVVFGGLTNSDFTVRMSALGLGVGDDAGNIVTDGHTARRLKWCGFQIAEVPSATLTGLSLGAPLPTFLAGNPSGYGVQVIGQFSNGESFPMADLPGLTYVSGDTNVCTVSADGTVLPRNPGVTSLVISYDSVSLTNTVTVLGPLAVRVSISPTTLYLGNNVADLTQAAVQADFATSSNVNVSAFNLVSFDSVSPAVVSVSPAGLVTPLAEGNFDLKATYAGMTATKPAAGMVALFQAPGTVDAISVNIPNGVNQMNFKDLSGAGARVAYWNNLPLTGTTASNQLTNPRDFRGNLINGVVIQMTGRSTGSSATGGTPTVNESQMFRSYYDYGLNSGAHADSVIVVSNVPYATYDVYFYVYNDTAETDRPGRFLTAETGANEYWRVNFNGPNVPANDGSGYVEAVSTVFPYPTSLAEVPGGNFVRISGLTNRDLLVTYGAGDATLMAGVDNTARLRLAGFQVVKSLLGLTATNLYLGAPIAALFPGNPVGQQLQVLADFTDGTVSGPVATLPGITYTSSDTNVFAVSSKGVLTAGTASGAATLVIAYQSLSLTQAVASLAPTAVRLLTRPDTLYLDGVLGSGTAQATVLADFASQSNVDITAFSGVTFNNIDPSLVSVDATGLVTPLAFGNADLSVSYQGVSWTNVDAVRLVSVTNAPTLKHRYSFREAPGDTVVVDSVAGVNGTLYPPLGTNLPITLEGDRAVFPGDGDYTVAPYIALPSAVLAPRNDITFDLWAGINAEITWSRFFDIGSSQKGTDPHASGNGIYSFYFTPTEGSTGFPRVQMQIPAGTIQNHASPPFALGQEQHITIVYSPNTGVMKTYTNGVLSDTVTATGLLTTLPKDNFWLGISQWNDPTLNGWLSELRIYEGAFTDQMVADSEAAGANVGLPPIVTKPTLSLSWSGANLQLSWPLAAADFVLKSNTVLNNTWFAVGINPTTNGNTLTVTVPPAGSGAFYLLEK